MKFFAALLVAFLAVQSSTQTPLQDDSTKTVIVKVLDTILGITSTIVQDVKAIAADFENNEASVTADVETYLAAIANEVNNLALKVVDLLKESASEDGLAVIQCLDGLEENIDIAYAETITLAGSCISEEYAAILVVVNQILDNVQAVEEEIQAQTKTLEECSGSDLTCLLAFASSLVDTGKELAEIVPSDVNAVVTLIQEIISHVSSCQLVDTVKNNVDTLFDQFAKCARA